MRAPYPPVDLRLVGYMTANYVEADRKQRREMRAQCSEAHADCNRHLAALHVEIAALERAIALRTALLDAWHAVEAAEAITPE